MNDDSLKGEGDRFLIGEIRTGSSDAFRRLVERFSGRLKVFAARRLQGSGIEPDDAVQETFLSLLRHLDRLEGVRSLQAYLFTILRCRIADLARARGPAARAVSLDGLESAAGVELPSPEGTPSTYVRRHEALRFRAVVLADVLDTFLSSLKAERQFRDLKILELIFCGAKSQQDAARLVGTSEPTVSRVRKASVEKLSALVARHPKAAALEDLPTGDDVSEILSQIWQENLFSCIKRSTLGSYALGVLDSQWTDYVRFHLEVTCCEYCAAHLSELEAGEGIGEDTRERIFASSIGFLRK